MTITFRSVLCGVFVSMGACGGADLGNTGGPASPGLVRQTDGRGPSDCPDRADFDTVSEKIEAQLNNARKAVCRYRRIEAALADGYVNTGLACVPGQGFHYIKNSLVGTTDIRHPPVLMYTAGGDLTSPEWVAPIASFPTPPRVFGESEHADDDLGLWILHVWVWNLNPNGVFEDVNPNVACP